MTKFVKLQNWEMDSKLNNCFGGKVSIDGKWALGVFLSKPDAGDARRALERKYGKPSHLGGVNDDSKWEYAFTHTAHPGIEFRIYEKEGWISCGFSIPKKMTMNPEKAGKLQAAMYDLVGDLGFKGEDLFKQK